MSPKSTASRDCSAHARASSLRGRSAHRITLRARFHWSAAGIAADVRKLCPLSTEPLALLEGAVTRGALSARAFDRVVRVARTIADLAAAESIAREHVAEALVYRGAASRG